MKRNAEPAGLRPATGLCPIPRGGFAPATRKSVPKSGRLESSASLPLVGPGIYTLCGWKLRPRVTFSIDPTETGLGYIVK